MIFGVYIPIWVYVNSQPLRVMSPPKVTFIFFSFVETCSLQNARLLSAPGLGNKGESRWTSMHPNKGYYLAMRRLLSSAAIMLAMALLGPLSGAQVRGAPAPEGRHHTGRSSTVAPPGHASVMPTPIGASPAPAPAIATPTALGVPPLRP